MGKWSIPVFSIPFFRKVRVAVNNEFKTVRITNVIGTIRGSVEPGLSSTVIITIPNNSV